MKSLFLSLVLCASLAPRAFAFNGTIGHSSALDVAGAVIPSSTEKQFVNIKNVSGGALLAGAVVTPDLASDDGVGGTTSATTGLSPWCILPNACAANALCSCQVYGYALANFDASPTSAVAGKRFFMSTANAGYISARGVELSTEVPGGIFYDAASVSGSVEVFIK